MRVGSRAEIHAIANQLEPLRVTAAEFLELGAFTPATGPIVGQRWRRDLVEYMEGAGVEGRQRPIWIVGEYVPDTAPGTCWIVWRRLIVRL